MMIAQLIDTRIQVEGDYVNNGADRGGPTRYGITQATARADGYMGDMRALPMDRARSIYRRLYWTTPRLDLVATIAPHIAGEMFDTGINCGTKAAIKLLQRALNYFQGAGIGIDGVIIDQGETIVALRAYMAARGKQDGELVMVEALNALQGVRYIEIVENDATQRAFGFGWKIGRAHV